MKRPPYGAAINQLPTTGGSITDPASGEVVPVPVRPEELALVADATGGVVQALEPAELPAVTDATVDAAIAAGARVERREWRGYGRQKNLAAELARHDFILSLDADVDEPGDAVVSGRLLADIAKSLPSRPVSLESQASWSASSSSRRPTAISSLSWVS